MKNQETQREMAGNLPQDSKSHFTARSRGRTLLETVAEMPNEGSGECTERLVQSRGSANIRQSSPFVVEKIEFNLDEIKEDHSRTEEHQQDEPRLQSKYGDQDNHRKHREAILDKMIFDSDAETKFPAYSYRTPAKPENQKSLFSPSSGSNGKQGFFSLRKKSAIKQSDSVHLSGGNPPVLESNPASNKIKIVNNIFQNTFLQNYSKPSESKTKRKINEVKFENKSKGAIRKKNNSSMDVKDSSKMSKQTAGLLSPQPMSDKRFSFHIPSGVLQLPSRPKNHVSLLHRQSTILEESVTSAKVLDQDKKYKQMIKFHEKLTGLIREVEGGSGEIDLKTSWRFVKNVVQGYVEARQKIKKLEEIINSK